MKRTKNKPLRCVVPGCSRPPRARGVCATCYASHRRAVAAGESTWELIEQAGLILPERKGIAARARQQAGIVSGTSSRAYGSEAAD